MSRQRRADYSFTFSEDAVLAVQENLGDDWHLHFHQLGEKNDTIYLLPDGPVMLTTVATLEHAETGEAYALLAATHAFSPPLWYAVIRPIPPLRELPGTLEDMLFPHGIFTAAYYVSASSDQPLTGEPSYLGLQSRGITWENHPPWADALITYNPALSTPILSSNPYLSTPEATARTLIRMIRHASATPDAYPDLPHRLEAWLHDPRLTFKTRTPQDEEPFYTLYPTSTRIAHVFYTRLGLATNGKPVRARSGSFKKHARSRRKA